MRGRSNPPGSLWLAFLLLPPPLAARKTPEPPAAIPPITAAFLESLPRKTGVNIRIFNTGRIDARGGAVTSKRSWFRKIRLDDAAFLIRHPAQGPILFDLGLSTESARRLNAGFLTGFFVEFKPQPGWDILSQLKSEGVSPKDIRWIILSHLHADHLSYLDEFPNATVVASRREWAAQKARIAKKKRRREFDPAAHEARLNLRLADISSSAPFGAFDHGLDLFGDGSLILVDLSGHTPGSLGAWVGLDGGPVLLAGDAAWVADNYADFALPIKKAIADYPRYLRTLRMLRRMKESVPGLVILPTHDLSPLPTAAREDLTLAPPPGK